MSLGLGALAGAVATLGRRGVRNLPEGAFLDDSPGEWPGTLGGTYHFGSEAVPYQARRVAQGLGVSAVAGVISGLAGVGGGFLKTPAMSEVMQVPVKVAAATSTFTMGITAAAGLIVFWGQGRSGPAPRGGDRARSHGRCLGGGAGPVAASHGERPSGHRRAARGRGRGRDRQDRCEPSAGSRGRSATAP